MSTFTKPSLRIRLYQLEENGGGTDLQKKSSPAQVAFTTGGASNDFHLISMSDITETIEIDKGVYQIDSVSLTVDGLAETFFNAYDDALNEPYICEIYDVNDSEVLFHGPIDRQSCRWEPKTQYTSFDVLSWAYVLEQTNAAARTVYETQLTKKYSKSSDETGVTSVTVPRIADDGTDMQDGVTDLIVSGDEAVLETTYGEWRATIMGVISKTASEVNLLILGEPESVILSAHAVAGGAIEKESYQSRQNSYYKVLKVEVSNANLWGALDAMRDDIMAQDDLSVRENSFINLAVTYSTSGDTATMILYPNGTKNMVTADGRAGDNPMAWSLKDDETTVVLRWTVADSYRDDADSNGLTIDSIVIPTNIKKGTKIRILGKDIYGYAPSGAAAAFKQHVANEVIEGLFSISDTGIFQYVADTFTYPTGFTSRTWPRFLEFPDNLIKSLRLMQNTERSFLKITPTLDGSDLPRMTIEVIDRTEVNTATLGAATAITDIISYGENVADLTPRGVIVKPHIKYNLPKGRKQYTTQGFYYDGYADSDYLTKPAPESGDLLKMDVNRVVDWADGLVFASNGKGVYRPDNLGRYAERFYGFYAALSRQCEFVMNGKLAATDLGGFVTLNEGSLTRTIFVTKRSWNPLTRETTVAGRVGEYTPTITTSPVAIIDGDLLYNDVGASGSTDIYLSGMRSYHPDGVPFTYSWVLDPLGAATVIGTDPILENTGMTVGSYTIRLTVDDTVSTDSVDVLLVIADDTATGDNTGVIEADFQNGPDFSVDSAGDIYVTVSGVKPYTDFGSSAISVDQSLTSNSGPWTNVGSYSNPVNDQLVYSGLAEDTPIWFRIQLLNDSDGATSSNESIVRVFNNLGGDTELLTISDTLTVSGNVDVDGGAADTVSYNIDSVEYVLVDNTGVLFDLSAGDSWDVMNSAGTVLTVDDGGFEVSVLSGDAFIVDVLGTDFLTIDESGIAFVQAALDEFSITHNSVKMFDLDDNGIQMTVPNTDYWKLTTNSLDAILLDSNGLHFDIATGDSFQFHVNSAELMEIDATSITMEVDLDLQQNDLLDVNDITAGGAGSKTISGFTINAGGANFGPAAVSSITVVNGIVTAIS